MIVTMTGSLSNRKGNGSVNFENIGGAGRVDFSNDLVWSIASPIILQIINSGCFPHGIDLANAMTPQMLITGGAGYIGGELVRQLLISGVAIRVVDSLLYGIAGLESIQNHPLLDLRIADLRDPDSVKSALTGIDTVVHLAAIVGDPACAFKPELAQSVNVDATESLVTISALAGVHRFILASTCSVYGIAGIDLTEDSPLAPVSHYARTKVAAERSVLAATTPGMTTTVLRFATLYGLAPRLRLDLVANILTARATRGLPISVVGGDNWRPFLHVADAARAIRHVVDRTEPLSGVFNVGSQAENYRLADLGRLVAELIPGVSLSITESGLDHRSYAVRFNRFGATGFAPQYHLPDGIVELRDWLAAHPEIEIGDPFWSNIASLEALAANGSSL